MKPNASFLRDTRGGVAVEFAIMLPIVLSLVFGIVQYGNILYVRQLMTHAAEEAARAYAFDSMAAADAQSLAENRLESTGLVYTVTVTEPGSDESNVKVEITTPMVDAALVNMLGNVMDGDVEVSVILRMLSSACSGTTPSGVDTEMLVNC